ncbi:hypothetical protein LCGC14_2463930 [marine sediment metagenome]|uniref:Uncharacterized protein n=1 Tax=marine sediment metagenome TaxID=412755 RepID=A0A0F9BCX8_9ZZZZ
MGKGGNGSRKRKGDRFELAVVKDQERIGRWAAKLRQGGGEVVDIVSIEKCQDGRCTVHSHVSHVFLIQAKVGGYMNPVERERLVMEARAIAATPLMAWKDKGIQYKDIS